MNHRVVVTVDKSIFANFRYYPYRIVSAFCKSFFFRYVESYRWHAKYRSNVDSLEFKGQLQRSFFYFSKRIVVV